MTVTEPIADFQNGDFGTSAFEALGSLVSWENGERNTNFIFLNFQPVANKPYAAPSLHKRSAELSLPLGSSHEQLHLKNS